MQRSENFYLIIIIPAINLYFSTSQFCYKCPGTHLNFCFFAVPPCSCPGAPAFSIPCQGTLLLSPLSGHLVFPPVRAPSFPFPCPGAHLLCPLSRCFLPCTAPVFNCPGTLILSPCPGAFLLCPLSRRSPAPPQPRCSPFFLPRPRHRPSPPGPRLRRPSRNSCQEFTGCIY